MNETLTISTQKPADAAYDYAALRQAGIQYIEQTASKIWTDYNIHDPGITSLELLCYAITDLSYRSSYRIPDLMLGKTDTPADIINHFHTAKDIFPNKALTGNDYRKLIIDVEGIKNAWLRKRTKRITADLTNKKLTRDAPIGARTKPVDIKGYYDVLIEFDTTVKDEPAQNDKISIVKTLLQANRNLDEDFVDIGKVKQQAFRLCSEIEIKADANPFEVLARIYFNIQLHLSPLVRFYSLNQMLDAGYTTDKIFEGSFISHGFIKEEELLASELKTEIRLSDLMQIILNTPGVLSIPDIIFNDINQKTELPNKWIIDVIDGFQPVVDIEKSNVVVIKNGVPFRPDPSLIKVKADALMDAYLNQNELVSSSDISFYTGTFRNVNDYHSIQNHFPKTYGVSHWGLPEDVTTERKKQAKQWKAYCWLFDQVLANYLAQLSSIRHLFSLDDEKQTYFTELAISFKDPEQIFEHYNKVTDINGKIDQVASWKDPRKNIQDEVEDQNGFNRRRNIFLDHLLSRFSESFYDYVGTLDALFPFTSPATIINVKRNFLKKYPEYSCQRALAYNYTDAAKLWDTNNVSGFEKRVQRLLGFENIDRRSLANFYTIIREEENAGVKKFWFEFVDIRNNVVLLQSDKFDAREKADEELVVATTLASTRENFKVAKDATDSKFSLELRDKLNKLIATGRKGTKKSAENDLDRLFMLFSAMSEEGMFLIEHLLLYDDTTEQFMPICVDGNCDECSDTDPYSFRISIVMPAYAPRFLNMDFRRYAEKVMREELPSHLMPKICWVSNEQLHELELAYNDWLQVKAGSKPDADGAIVKKFIEVLTSLKSIYPEGHLLDCSTKVERELFMLNKNSLGTQKTT
jgi:uncharacterized protein